MRKEFASACALMLLVVLSCSNSEPILPNPTSGTFTLLTYNVAGLPQGISPSNPEKNIPLISPLLNRYDVVLVQEDFFYHEELQAEARHPFRSQPKADAANFTHGDGLNRFSDFPFHNLERHEWAVCSNTTGNDCLAQKGFSVAETILAPGVTVDIYNLHLDAGGSQRDQEARTIQIQQLLHALISRSTAKAIILAGDTNLDSETRNGDEQLLRSLLTAAGLEDACRSQACEREMVDRVLFRGNSSLDLRLVSWKVDSAFVDEVGRKLSDHEAIAVTFEWEAR